MPSVEAELKAFLASITGADAALGDDTDLLETGVLDSVGVYEILGFIEERFGYFVPDADVVPDNFRSISTIAAMVCRGLDGAWTGPRSSHL